MAIDKSDKDLFLYYDELCVLTNTDDAISNQKLINAYLKEEVKQDIKSADFSNELPLADPKTNTPAKTNSFSKNRIELKSA